MAQAKCKTTLIIDAHDHTIGRLASTVAKKLLSGEAVAVVHCEAILLPGKFEDHKNKFKEFLNKRCAYNPKKGPYHHKEPAKIFYRKVRKMIPHKTARGAAAMERLETFEGVPPHLEAETFVVVPSAQKHNSLYRDQPSSYLCRLSSAFGWKHAEAVKQAEKTRLGRLQEKKQQKEELRQKQREFSKTNAQMQQLEKTLLGFGYSLSELE